MTLEEQLNNEILEINTELAELIAPIREQQNNGRAPKTRNTYEVCKIFETSPQYTEQEKVQATSYIDDIVREAKADPIKWGDLRDTDFKVFQQPGQDKGLRTGMMPIKEFRYPTWLKELGESIRLFSKRTKVRKDLQADETMEYTVKYKDKGKHNKAEKSVYIILDTSGSMWNETIQGKPILEYFVSFFPGIAKHYTGEIWEVDTELQPLVLNLKDCTERKMRDFFIQGGGGTNFLGAFKLLLDKKKKLEEEGKKSEFITIVLTDGYVQWQPDSSPLMLDHMVIVMPKGAEKYAPKPSVEKDRTIILIPTEK